MPLFFLGRARKSSLPTSRGPQDLPAAELKNPPAPAPAQADRPLKNKQRLIKIPQKTTGDLPVASAMYSVFLKDWTGDKGR